MKVTVSQTLSKSFTINKDEDETIVQAFLEQHWTIPALLDVLREYLEYDLKYLDRKPKASSKRLLAQLASCKGWTSDEFEVIQE